MKRWLMRIQGVLDLVCAAIGVWYGAGMLMLHWHRWPPSATARDWLIFWLLLALAWGLTVSIAICGVALIRERRSAILLNGYLFAALIATAIADFVVVWLVLPRSMGKIAFGVWDVALSPIEIEAYTCIPFVGCVLLLIAAVLYHNSDLSIPAGSASIAGSGESASSETL